MQNPLDIFGLRPLPTAIRQAAMVFRGATGVPPSRFGLSSLGIFHPKIALTTWLGRRAAGDKVAIITLFNHTQSPFTEGWSVRRTHVRDFRGRGMTYDSHNGTDFAVVPGHRVVAAAPGRVVRVSNELHRGGVKVVMDHGNGLMTTSNHLMRATVAVSDLVKRGETIAISGASGIDMIAAFPWNCPHVHFNTWLDGEPVDPFSTGSGEASLWRGGDAPGPALPTDEPFPEPTAWNMDGIAKLVDDCKNTEFRDELMGIGDAELRAANTVFYRNYYPNLFDQSIPLVMRKNERSGRLDMPFGDFSGIVFGDDL